jgi:hypothetical protein
MGITNNTYTLYYEKDNHEVLDFYKYKENYLRVEYDTVCDELYIFTTEGIDNPDFYTTDAGGFPFNVLYDSEDNISIGIILSTFSLARKNNKLWTDLLSIKDSELPLELQDNIIYLRNGMPYTITTVIPMLYEFFLNGHAYKILGMVEGTEFPSDNILVINPFSDLKEHDFDTTWIMGDLELGIGSTLHWDGIVGEEDSPAKKLLEAFEKELAEVKHKKEKPKNINLELPDDLYIDGKSVHKLLAEIVGELQTAACNGLYYEREIEWIKNYLQEKAYPYNKGKAQIYIIAPSVEDALLLKTYFSIFIPVYRTGVLSQALFNLDMQAKFCEEFGRRCALNIINSDCSAGKDYDDLELCGIPFEIKKEE